MIVVIVVVVAGRPRSRPVAGRLHGAPLVILNVVKVVNVLANSAGWLVQLIIERVSHRRRRLLRWQIAVKKDPPTALDLSEPTRVRLAGLRGKLSARPGSKCCGRLSLVIVGRARGELEEKEERKFEWN